MENTLEDLLVIILLVVAVGWFSSCSLSAGGSPMKDGGSFTIRDRGKTVQINKHRKANWHVSGAVKVLEW